ncbi:DNA polymerase I [bacterium]|nr:DNA polymerase I [bacterium]NDG29222.1 DNA polymerase I [bacterium]
MTEVPKKLAIIDGKSVFYRGYYAMPNLSTKDGTPTGGVYGFAAMALELIKRLKPDYVCVAWDKPKTNIRKRLAIYPDYKAGRKPAPPDFYAQIPILHEVLEAFNWPLYELDDYEADDIMCSISKKAAAEGIETMLISSDLDMLQCVGPLTHMYALKKGLTNIERFDIEAFEAKYGITVDQFLDLKSLKGDGSDNIPGVPGIGEKGAVDLLQQFKTLDGIYENVSLIKDSLAKKLIAGKESAYMSQEVARLYDDAPIPLDLTEMDVNKLDTARLKEILIRLEFRSLLRNLPEGMKNTDAAKPVGHHEVQGSLISGGLVDLHEKPCVHITKHAELADIKLQGDVVLHARAAGKNGDDPKVLILSDSETTYAIDLRKVTITLGDITLPPAVIGHDVKNSFKVLLELGLELPRVAHDTLVGSFIVNSLAREQTLTDIATRDLGFEGNLEDLDDDQLLERASELASVVAALANIQGEQMSEVTSLIKLAETVDWPVIPVLAHMERAGIKIDPSFFANFSTDLEGRISDIEQTIYGYANQEFNISSPSQLSEILFVKLALPISVTKKGKAGHYSTAVDVLDKLKDTHPIIECIQNYREFTKLKSTYVDTLPKLVDKHDRVHTTFNLTIAATGRLSSIDPNLQNIPVRTELGREIRKGFITEPGNVFVSADYSQFELRIAAAMSGDEGMITAFNNDRDIHTETAALIQGIDPKDVTKEMRYAAKAVNFGILYGQGTFGLASGTGISMNEAKDFIDKYFMVRPKLKDMITKFRGQADKRGYVETLLGRRRPTPDAKSPAYMVREGAFRAAVNMPIQGTAADLTKMAMTAVNPMLPKGATQLLQIHDSILVECLESDAEQVGKLLKQTMENIYPSLGVNLRVDVSIGKNWGEL